MVIREETTRPESSTEETTEIAITRNALHYLRKTVNDEHAQFKSPEQQQLLENILSKHDNILAIIPTGGGKSVAWEATVQAEPNTITIVATPFKSLIIDQLRRAKALNINAMEWTFDTFPEKKTQLVFISWELTFRIQVTKYVYFIKLFIIHY